ncbi:hypothetical protein F5Y10DRAFT_230915 [Nemania abortiva]|nr:hypothetical protein F5Y10DRAFT_230915 [Nemania abortiva]
MLTKRRLALTVPVRPFPRPKPPKSPKVTKTTTKPQRRKETRASDAFCVLSHSALNPCTAVVSSEAACELICSYSWLDSKQASIKIPGFPPLWQPIPLPVTLPPDNTGKPLIHQSKARVPEYSFEPVFRAAETMNRTTNFDDVDIVVNRNNLGKLLRFCGGTVFQGFRVGLSMVNNTLFIERGEKNARGPIRGPQKNRWGHNFEKAFTKLPKGLEHSTEYHRVVKYPLGELNCVICFEVDACYQEDNGKRGRITSETITRDSLALDMGKLSIKRNPGNSKVVPAQIHSAKETRIMPQSATAEIKSNSGKKRQTRFMSQLWFGRTRWLIVGYHIAGKFGEVRITNAEAGFAAWETRHQNKLKKLVSLLSELRELVKKSGFNHCIAICEQGKWPRELKIFASTRENKALPNDLITKFWHANTDEAAVKATI